MGDANCTPTKKCTKCGDEKPATLEYFYKHPSGKSGIASRCKACCIILSAERHERLRVPAEYVEPRVGEDGIPIKTCAKCGGEFPATLEHFYADGGGKLSYQCKPCKNAAAAERRARRKALHERDVPHAKVCSKCGKNLPATREYFYSDSGTATGLEHRCKICRNAAISDRYAKDPEKFKEVRRKWQADNPDKSRETCRNSSAKRRAEDPDKMRAINRKSSAKRRAEDPDKVRDSARKQAARYRAEDPCYVLKGRLSRRLNHVLKAVGGKNGRRSMDILGYTPEELRAHIESKFVDGMTWANLRRGEIHIDHVIPVVSFGISSADDPRIKECWGLENLQPLWAAENLEKNGRMPGEYAEYLLKKAARTSDESLLEKAARYFAIAEHLKRKAAEQQGAVV